MPRRYLKSLVDLGQIWNCFISEQIKNFPIGLMTNLTWLKWNGDIGLRHLKINYLRRKNDYSSLFIFNKNIIIIIILKILKNISMDDDIIVKEEPEIMDSENFGI